MRVYSVFHIDFAFQLFTCVWQLALKENRGGALIRSFVHIFKQLQGVTDVFCESGSGVQVEEH